MQYFLKKISCTFFRKIEYSRNRARRTKTEPPIETESNQPEPKPGKNLLTGPATKTYSQSGPHKIELPNWCRILIMINCIDKLLYLYRVSYGLPRAAQRASSCQSMAHVTKGWPSLLKEILEFWTFKDARRWEIVPEFHLFPPITSCCLFHLIEKIRYDGSSILRKSKCNSWYLLTC